MSATETIFQKASINVDKISLKKTMDEAVAEISREAITYTEASKQRVQFLLDAAELVYNNSETTQAQIDWWNNEIQKAVEALNSIGAVKTELKTSLSVAEEYLKDTENYSAADIESLRGKHEGDWPRGDSGCQGWASRYSSYRIEYGWSGEYLYKRVPRSAKRCY